MKAAELGLENVELPNGPVPKRCTFEYLTDPKVLQDLLYRTEELTDEAYAELVDDIGARAARLILRTKALSGDIRALDLYLRIAREDAERRRQHDKPAARNVHATTFIQAERVQAVPDPATTEPDPPNNNP